MTPISGQLDADPAQSAAERLTKADSVTLLEL